MSFQGKKFDTGFSVVAEPSQQIMLIFMDKQLTINRMLCTICVYIVNKCNMEAEVSYFTS